MDFLLVEDGEDKRSIEQHINIVKKIWGKGNCNMTIVSDRMSRAYGVQRDLVKKGQNFWMSLNDIQCYKFNHKCL